jgi:hypothetical protein
MRFATIVATCASAALLLGSTVTAVPVPGDEKKPNKEATKYFRKSNLTF